MNKLQKSKYLATLLLALGFGVFLFGVSLFWLQSIAIAAPPELPVAPPKFTLQSSLTITGTKTSTPAVTVEAGGVLTYTIVFSSDVVGTIVVTDAIPNLTEYIAGTISGTVATSTNIIVSDTTSLPTLGWAITNQVTQSLITLTFGVAVTNSLVTDSLITNTVWISQAPQIYSRTHVVTATAINQVIYLSKTSTPAVTVEAGGVLTYTIVLSSNMGGSIVVTDAIPNLTEYIAGTISSTAINTIVPDDSSSSTLGWTITNTVTHSPITLTFAVAVTNTVVTGTLITNTAWLSQAANIYSNTHIVAATAQTAISTSVYLPIVLKNYRCSKDAYEPNDIRTTTNSSLSQEWTLGSGTTISGNFCTEFSDPADYFWLTLSAGTTLNVVLSPPSTADYDLYIYKGVSATSIAASSANTGLGVGENVSYSIPSAGIYFIRVHPFNKGDGDSYTLKVTY